MVLPDWVVEGAVIRSIGGGGWFYKVSEVGSLDVTVVGVKYGSVEKVPKETIGQFFHPVNVELRNPTRFDKILQGLEDE